MWVGGWGEVLVGGWEGSVDGWREVGVRTRCEWRLSGLWAGVWVWVGGRSVFPCGRAVVVCGGCAEAVEAVEALCVLRWGTDNTLLSTYTGE